MHSIVPICIVNMCHLWKETHWIMTLSRRRSTCKDLLNYLLGNFETPIVEFPHSKPAKHLKPTQNSPKKKRYPSNVSKPSPTVQLNHSSLQDSVSPRWLHFTPSFETTNNHEQPRIEAWTMHRIDPWDTGLRNVLVDNTCPATVVIFFIGISYLNKKLLKSKMPQTFPLRSQALIKIKPTISSQTDDVFGPSPSPLTGEITWATLAHLMALFRTHLGTSHR